MSGDCCINTDKEIWRKVKDDYYSPSIHVTADGRIGIDVGGRVIVAPIEKWHDAGENYLNVPDPKYDIKHINKNMNERYGASNLRDTFRYLRVLRYIRKKIEKTFGVKPK
jgi:hypothetical protein